MRGLLAAVALSLVLSWLGAAPDASIALPADDGGLAGRHCDGPHRPPDDWDCDTVPDREDNCPDVSNADQVNTDAGYTETDPPAADGSPTPMAGGDGDGDACDGDDDADGMPDLVDGDGDGQVDARDNCRTVRNPEQYDANANGYGEDAAGNDLCAVDRDGDGVPDEQDSCPAQADPGQEDLDGDGLGDACDPDDDGDGVPDYRDNCPTVSNEAQADRDGDGVGTACDPGEISSTPPPEPAPAADAEPPGLTVRTPSRHRAGDLAGRLPIEVGCTEACGLSARLEVSGRTARARRIPRVIARGEAFLGGRGETFLFLEARPRAIRRLRRMPGRRVRAALHVRAVDPAGNRRVERRRLTLRRGG